MTVTADVNNGDFAAIVAIEQLIYRYSDAVTRGDRVQFEALWTPDIAWEVVPQGIRVEGLENVCETVAQLLETYESFVQVATNPVITLLDDEHATASTIVHEMGKRKLGAEPNPSASGDIDLYGVYEDKIVWFEQRWRFSHRRFVSIFGSREPLGRETFTPHRSLLKSPA